MNIKLSKFDVIRIRTAAGEDFDLTVLAARKGGEIVVGLRPRLPKAVFDAAEAASARSALSWTGRCQV